MAEEAQIDELRKKKEPDFSYYPPEALSTWCDKQALERLLPAMGCLHDYYFYRVLKNCPYGYCDIGILAVEKGGIVLGFQLGTPDEHTDTIHWRTRFVPRSLIGQEGLSAWQLGMAIYDLPAEPVAEIIGHPIEDPDASDEDDQDGAEEYGDEYLQGQCELFQPMAVEFDVPARAARLSPDAESRTPDAASRDEFPTSEDSKEGAA